MGQVGGALFIFFILAIIVFWIIAKTAIVVPQQNAYVVERPDGYHWVSTDGRHEFGPFATLAEAQADMDGYAGTGNSADLQEAEDALGLNDWDGDDLGTAGDLPGGIDDD